MNKYHFLLAVLLLAKQQSALAAHANYENKDFQLSDCNSLSTARQKTDCSVDYAISHHIFYWGNTIYDANPFGPVETGFAAAYGHSPEDVNVANAYAASLMRNEHVKKGIEQYKNNFVKFGDFQSGFIAYSQIRAAANTPGERQDNTQELYSELVRKYPQKMQQLTAVLDNADMILQDKELIDFEIPKVKNPGRYHAIVVLGYQLDKKGNAQEPLMGIMDQALKVAQAYPNSKIIVTGGVPRNDRVEAEVMSDFFTSHGVDKSRIIPEVLAYDTLQNSNYVAMIMRNFNIREATIVTRAGHIRRGTALMKTATNLYVPWPVEVSAFAWKDTKFKTQEETKLPPKLGDSDYRRTYRDVLRLYLQEYPGFAN